MCKVPLASAVACESDGSDVSELRKSLELVKPLPTFTRREIAERRHDLVIIEDRVYDAARFRWAHPGGAVFVAVFGGRDGTLAFQSYHMREFPHEKMSPYLVGTLDANETPVSFDQDHLALCKQLRPVLAKEEKGSFAKKSQIIKAGVILSAAVGVEAYMMLFGRTWALSLLLGFTFALIGLNIQHDANHGAMFRNGTWNAVWGLAQNWIGGSQLMWLHEHVVLHHLHTGDVDMDPDAQLAPVMRGHSEAKWFPWMRFQQFYFLLVELGYGAIPMFMSFAEVLCWSHKFEKKFALSRLSWPWGVQSTLMHLLFYVRMLLLPTLAALRTCEAGQERHAVALELAKVASTVVVAGGYLAFFFFLSHNFDGVEFVSGADATGACAYQEDSGFLKQQAASSSNVAGRKLCTLNGGLNYQIEHHLFPRIAHSHYPTIAPIVKKFVLGKGGKYLHFETVGANLASVFCYLSKFGDPNYSLAVPGPAPRKNKED